VKLFKKLGIDLGTANSVVWEAGVGIVLNEPTVVAIGVDDRKILAVGKEAKKMLGKTPEYIEVIQPMEEGVIADYEVTEAMIKYFLRQVMGRAWFIGPEVMVCVPAGVTQVEQRAVLDATMSAGARKAYLIDEPLAAAIGAKIPVSEPFGNMIVDIGGGAAEAAVISLGGVVTHKTVRMGGNKIDRAISEHLRKKNNLIIGDQTAEAIKIKDRRPWKLAEEIRFMVYQKQ
jgi:rod shape-determining protein MreB and related proteins